MALDLQQRLSQDYQNVVRSLRSINRSFSDAELKKAARKAAKPVRDQAEKLTPALKKGNEHYRYKKLLPGKQKAPKGKGNIVATYKKGNLKKSIKILSFGRDKKGVYVGPKFAGRGNGGGVFGQNRTKVDGYYAHMVFGSARAFQARVTALALRVKGRASVDIFQAELEKKLQQIRQRTGL